MESPIKAPHDGPAADGGSDEAKALDDIKLTHGSSYFSLSPDVTKKTLATLPLREFQMLYDEEAAEGASHASSFAERYQLRYDQSLPEQLMGMAWESEEERYLFFAAYRSGEPEVGYRSHLFLSPRACVLAALRQRDDQLAQYFLKRSPVEVREDQQVLELALKHGLRGAVRLLEPKYTDWCCQHELEPGMLELLVRKGCCRGGFLFLLHRDYPLDAIDELLVHIPEPDVSIGWASIVCGLIASEQADKLIRARQMIEEQIEDPDVEAEKLARALGYLGDLALFRRAWPTLSGLNYASAVPEALIHTGAVAMLRFIFEDDYFRSAHFAKGLLPLDHEYEPTFRAEALPSVLEFLRQHCHKSIRNSKFMVSAYAFLGDRRLLDLPWHETHPVRVILMLYVRGHSELLVDYLRAQLEAVGEDEKVQESLRVPDGLLKFLLDHDLLAALDAYESVSIACCHLSLDQWQKVQSDAAEVDPRVLRKLIEIAPTPPILQRLLHVAGLELETDTPAFATFPGSLSMVQAAAFGCNFEYVQWYLRSTLRLAEKAAAGSKNGKMMLENALT